MKGPQNHPDEASKWLCPSCGGTASFNAPKPDLQVSQSGEDPINVPEAPADVDSYDVSPHAPKPWKLWPPFGLLGSKSAMEALGPECSAIPDEAGSFEDVVRAKGKLSSSKGLKKRATGAAPRRSISQVERPKQKSLSETASNLSKDLQSASSCAEQSTSGAVVSNPETPSPQSGPEHSEHDPPQTSEVVATTQSTAVVVPSISSSPQPSTEPGIEVSHQHAPQPPTSSNEGLPAPPQACSRSGLDILHQAITQPLEEVCSQSSSPQPSSESGLAILQAAVLKTSVHNEASPQTASDGSGSSDSGAKSGSGNHWEGSLELGETREDSSMGQQSDIQPDQDSSNSRNNFNTIAQVVD
jgi:hypothetical protein